MQLLTPPSAHREVVQCQASERRALAAERRESALAAQLAQERARAVECKREQLLLAQREREAYLANVRSLFQMDSSEPGSLQQCTSGNAGGGLRTGALQRRVPPPLPRAPSAAANERGSSSSSSSQGARPAPVQKSHAVKSPGKIGQPAWSEVSTAAPSMADGGEDDFAECPSSFLSTPAAARTAAVPESSELLRSLDLQVGERLRASLKDWLEAEEEKESTGDSLSPRPRGRPVDPTAMLPSLADSLEDLGSAFRDDSRARSNLHAGARDVLEESISSSSSEDEVLTAPTAAAKGDAPQLAAAPPKVPDLAAFTPSVGQARKVFQAPRRPAATAVASSAAAAVPSQVPTRIPAAPAVSCDAAVPARPPRSTSSGPSVRPAAAPATASTAVAQQSHLPRRTPAPSAPSAASAPVAAPPAKPLRSSSSRPPEQTSRSKSPAVVPTIRAPGPSMRALVSEEEALQQSLLRMDFQEMKRQFGGKEPLWRGAEVLSESLVTDPKREGKLQASLERLNNVLSELRSRNEVRLKELAEKAKGEGDAASQPGVARCPSRERVPTAANGKRLRPRSASAGRSSAYAGPRNASAVPTVAAAPAAPVPAGGRAASAGRCREATAVSARSRRAAVQGSCVSGHR
eukprot:TRINITY_DN78797_c0_g1_i1.p1 TRINITY_DN78797_c0_g1~~TRINITY_DN78797_c0_g1_i1.p1  ORF type:complete len:633 (-),score=127.61 TRINITY_DN78797_c0_g1_i1:46-1944(-)